MAEQDQGPKFQVNALIVNAHEEGIDLLAGIGHTTGPGMSAEEKRFDIAEQTGMLPEEIRLLSDDIPAHKVGKKSVAFSANRWNASWDPHGDNPVLH